MPNDAKLGLVVGVGLVIGVAVVFFRKDLAPPPADAPAANAVSPAPAAAPAVPRGQTRPTRARAMGRTAEAVLARHTVQPGDTLFSLAQHYYGDGDRFADIYHTNRNVLKAPEPLPPGTVLVIPELTKTPEDSREP